MDLARGVISGELDLAIVTAPPNDPRITAAVFARIPLYVALPESHRAALKRSGNAARPEPEILGVCLARRRIPTRTMQSCV